VRFGTKCLTRDEDTGEEICFHLVGAAEINFWEESGVQAVSVVSPIGKGLLGKKLNECALIKAPMGERILKIIKIL